MTGLTVKGLGVAALIAVVAVPAASARSAERVRLSVLPLPASSLGSAAESLPLQPGSGVLTNKGLVRGRFFVYGAPVTPNRSFDPTGNPRHKHGRISGYVLDYGLGASGGAGITEVRTSVDEYKTSGGAEKGLTFLKQDDLGITQWVGSGLSVAIKKQKVAAVGSERFAFFVGYRAANIAPLFGLDEQFTEGRYQADVTVWAGTAAAVKQLAPTLARKLDARIKQALAGRLHAQPVQLPPIPKAGPPPGGPDLAPLGLQTSDLGAQATDLTRMYMPLLSRLALSDYTVVMAPAGPLSQLQQQILWYPTANQASLSADFDAAFFRKDSLDLSSVGDGARGVFSYNSKVGQGLLVFSSGALEEYIFFNSKRALTTAQVESIAQTVANHINSAGLGS